jgi:hypothetical protein
MSVLVLKEFWRNDRWAQLFPHMGCADPSRNGCQLMMHPRPYFSF